jgi:quercetin dioxygenase-like cupin family protein
MMKANHIILLLSAILIFTSGLHAQSTTDSAAKRDAIFPAGEKAPVNNFTGTVWVKLLIPNDSVFNCVIGSVTFEAGARSNWHYHPAGQILLITAGTGYYQEKGNPIRVMRKGDVIKCPPNVEHWHGASAGSMMTHIAINPNTKKGIVVWLQKVSDEAYKKPE